MSSAPGVPIQALVIQLDELDKRNMNILRWLMATMAIMAAFRVYARYSGDNLSHLGFVADLLTLLLGATFFFLNPTQKERFNHYLRIDEEGIKLKRPLHSRKVQSWSNIARVEIYPIKMVICLRKGDDSTIKLNDISHEKQQQFKPALNKALHVHSAERGFVFAQVH